MVFLGFYGRKTRVISFVATLLGACVGGVLAPHALWAAEVTGAGSSFAAPLYEAWSAASEAQTGVRVNYQTIGSGAGQNQVLAGTVDFGASDAPMPPEKLAKGQLLQFPTAIGGIVVIANIPGVAVERLKLTGPILADLYAGTITTWNDPRIVALNPDLNLPDLPVAPLHRADGSGTTYVFTEYLTQVAPQWRDTVGRATSVAWPLGAGARGNDGIAAYVHNTQGSIGYIEYAYAVSNHLAAVRLQNKAGSFVAPTAESFAAAADAAEWSEADLTALLTNTAGAGAWPIVTTTYALVPRAAQATRQGKDVKKFFCWGLSAGEVESRKLDYVPVPERIKAVVLQRLNTAP